MPLIPQDFIDEIVDSTDIVDTISNRVNLKKSGNKFSACCPFHNEKTASFYVDPSKQYYHCFGCGAGGNVITFLMDYDNLSFPDAVETLATDLGKELPVNSHFDFDPKKKEKREKLISVMNSSLEHFQNELYKNESAKQYILGRNVKKETLDFFKIGYSPNDYDFLINKFSDIGLLIDSGMVVSKDNKTYDRFRDRIMFPIRNKRGETIGFGGRVIGSSDNGAKYLNSPETEIFHKKNELYGFYEYIKKKSKSGRVVVVEGYMDVVSLFDAGIDYAVASMGTAITREQISSIFRYSDEVVFCFDGDKAGKNAAWKAVNECLPLVKANKQVKFLFLPDGEDPDTMVKKIGLSEFERLLSNSQSLSDFFVNKISEGLNLDKIEGRASFAQEAGKYIELMPKGIYKSLLTDAIVNISGVNEEVIVGNSQSPRKKETELKKKVEYTPVRKAISLLLNTPSIVKEIEGDEWRYADVKGIELLGEIVDVIRSKEDMTSSVLIERFRNHKHFDSLKKLIGYNPINLNQVDYDGYVSELDQVMLFLVNNARQNKTKKMIQGGELDKEAILQSLTTMSSK